MGIGGKRSNKEYIYVDKDPDYNNCPNCKKKDAEYDKWYKECYSTNPDPSKYTILEYAQYVDCFVVKVVYDNIKEDRYERVKIMVLKASPIDLLKDRKLDPHFAKDGIVIARFKPDDEGWQDAIAYAQKKSGHIGPARRQH